ncbi:ATPase family protein associated with various cellular activities (AAA) [Streptomyces sp. TLI_235]|nr:ATPase family protein associated with various cellular activities (AAA) [Streptomyces sp. TLI_235]
MSAPPWQVLADTLLQREALVCRVGEGRPPRDFAGLYVAREDLDRVLRALPGLDGPDLAAVQQVRDHLQPQLAVARERFAGSLAGGGEFARLVRRVGLGDAEAELLAVLCAVDLSPARMRLVNYLQDSVQLPRLTLGTAARMLGSALPAAPGGRLATAALVTVDADGPWANRMLAPADRVLWALTGHHRPDPELPFGASRIALPTEPDPAAAPEVLLVSAGDAAGRLRAVADHRPGQGLLVSPVPASPAGWRALVREASIGALAVVLELGHPPDRELCEQLDRADHLTWALSSDADLPLDVLPRRRWSELRVDSALADAADWAAAFGTGPVAGARLTRDQLGLVARVADGRPDRVPGAMRRLAGGHLDRLAVRVSPERGWDDLVLPPDHTRRLREIVTRHRRRHLVHHEWGFPPLPSTGVVALFSGPSGTGKTLAAEIVAGELGLDLYKVNLSSVVSKYIGETEKNLERIFGAASAGELVLFFDEADALFGKRSEVSDAHDRYANIEVAYLLQRLESYDGIVVLATNLQRNIDEAFLRRISVGIDFEPPDETHRRRIWHRAFPPAAPVVDLDVDFLAERFRITGGTIRNAALGAAFRAAEGGGPITTELVVLALHREFQKIGRLCTEAEFGRYLDLVEADVSEGEA